MSTMSDSIKDVLGLRSVDQIRDVIVSGIAIQVTSNILWCSTADKSFQY